MSSTTDSDPLDTLSLAETDVSDDFELVDIDTDIDEVRSFAPSSIGSDVASTTSDSGSPPSSPHLDASHFHFPDPVPAFHDHVHDEGNNDTNHDDVHNDDELHLRSSSIYTLMATSQQASLPALEQPIPQETVPTQPSSTEASQQSPVVPFDIGTIEKMDFVREQADEKPLSPSKSHRALVVMAPKAAWFVALFAAVLLGFKSSTLLGFSPVALSSTHWNTKFASPSSAFSSASSASNLLQPSTSMAVPLALASSPSPSALTIKSDKKPETKAGLPRASPRRSSSVALQNAASKSHSVASHLSADSSKVQRPVRASNPPVKGAKNRRYAAFADQLAFDSRRNLAVYAPLAGSSSIDNATTTSWAFWLAELDLYYQASVRPALVAGKQQAYEAARLAQRYYQDQVLPAVACLREHALSTVQQTAEFASEYNQAHFGAAFSFVREQATQKAKRKAHYRQEVLFPAFTHFRLRAAEAAKVGSKGLNEAAKRLASSAHRTAEFTSQYHDEQIRPAFAFAREQAVETAKRTAQYHDKVLLPAVAQFRIQASEAAKTTSEGLNKAAQRFSAEAAETVQQVKEATNIDLEALGFDEYVGFMMTTAKSIKQILAHSHESA